MAKQILIDGFLFPTIKAAAAHYGIEKTKAAMVVARIEMNVSDPPSAINAFFLSRGNVNPSSKNAIKVEGVWFSSLTHAANHYCVSTTSVRSRLSGLVDPSPDEVLSAFELTSIVVKGVRFASISAAAKHYGVKASTASHRLNHLENPTNDEIDKCFVNGRRINGGITVKGVWYPSVLAAAKFHGIGKGRIYRRLGLLENPTADEISECFVKSTSITVNRVEYPSAAAAARHYGISVDKTRRLLRRLKSRTEEEVDRCFGLSPTDPA
tara:strand:+ start:3100 stop:3900 length:801 start_codon:yes stop_codon:yes gene_type:complete